MSVRARRAIRGAAIALAALLAACGDEETARVAMAPPVYVETVGAHRVVDRIEATGELLAPAAATVAAQVDGPITEILVDEGGAVDADDVVLAIDPERRELELRNQRAQLAEASAQLQEAERELARIRKLQSSGVASQARLDDALTQRNRARSRRDAASAQLGLAERALADASVRAPFAGLIARRYVNEGELVQRGTRLFDLVALDPIEVVFHLPERDSGRVKVGDPVGVRVAPFPGETFDATVTVVSPTIDPVTRTLRVKGEVTNPRGRLRPGLFARVDLGVAVREDVPMIPAEAVLQRADGAIGFRLVGDDRVERRQLELGVHRGDMVEVVDGFAIGDRVVVRGASRLVDGSVVSLRDRDGRPLDRVGATASTASETATP